jgi:ABC-type uncharacterized transport system permease subunit
MWTGAFYVVVHLAVAAMYVVLALLAWRELNEDPAAAVARGRFDALTVAVPLVVLQHGFLLFRDVAGAGALQFGFAHALSATLWLAVLIVWAEGFFVAVRGLHVFLLPAAAVSVVLPAVFQGAPITAAGGSLALRLHLLAAISAYSLLTIAAMHALLMASMDRQLHAAGAGAETAFARILRQVPPLLAMERLLFKLIAAGFVLLTATLVSGVFFSEALFGRALRFDHKTVFTLASWLVFAGLLAGRAAFGWRGRTALRWTLAGFVMLLLAYVGSRFVLEVVLQRL